MQLTTKTTAMAQLMLFTATLFIAALLLFWIQPLFSKMVLPFLGGSPSVWNTAMVFFQATLLGGYAYAHVLNRSLPPKGQLWVHLILLAAAAAFLPVLVPADWQPNTTTPPAVSLLLLLGACVGVPFFAVAATAPLLQRWFSHTAHPHAQDPYFLYAASNAGSVVILLAFPFILEPRFATVGQSFAWAGGFGLLALCIAGCGACVWIRSRQSIDSSVDVAGAAWPSWRDRLGWIAYSAVPSSLLLGVTTHISTDIASAPLLWVIPLALYLLSFVNAFARRPLIPQSVAIRAMAFGLVALAVTFRWREPAGVFLPLHLVAFFATALACHGELARRRPASAALTEYYLFVSLGGLMGGAFVAILAPILFSSVLEYPLSLVLAAALLPHASRTVARKDLVLAAIIAGFVLGAPILAARFDLPNIAVAAALAFIAALVLARQFRPRAFALCIAALLLAAVRVPWNDNTIWSGRSFFGVYRVTETAEPPTRNLIHGTTNHGGQWMPAVEEIRPTTYHTPESPVVDIVRKSQARNGRQRVALVGLGSGALAYYRRPADEWRYFEIDPLIRWLATESGHFQMMARQDPDAEIVLGDARLALAQQPDRHFDLLIMEAFTSDAIPTHLLTREAVAMYVEKLASDGLLVLHISNRFLDLEPVVAGVVAELGLVARRRHLKDPDRSVNPTAVASRWVVVAREDRSLDALDLGAPWSPLEHADKRVWRDDYSSLVGIIRWQG